MAFRELLPGVAGGGGRAPGGRRPGRTRAPAQARHGSSRASASRRCSTTPPTSWRSASGRRTGCTGSGARSRPRASSRASGRVAGHAVMIVANDATVKAGAFVPMTCKKVIRAQRIAFECGLPLVYLVDSSGVFLPMQDEIFPDEDDFGRIFRNNAVLSAAGLPQFAAIMGNCVAGGAYLPVLCDKILMTEGSGLYLAGPSLVKAAIGQDTDSEALGGAAMHAEISGTVDFREKDDQACLARLRSLVGLLPAEAAPPAAGGRGRDGAAARGPVRARRPRRPQGVRCARRPPVHRRFRVDRRVQGRATARTSSAPTRASAGAPSASSPTSASACSQRRPGCRCPASSTPTARTRRRGSSWTATRRACRSSSSRTSPASWWARTPSTAASSEAARSSSTP